MNHKFQDLMYYSGLVATGCWDEMDAYDREAVEQFAELIVKECALIVENDGRFLKYDKLAAHLKTQFEIK
jgi:hypothetical protein